MTTSRRRARGHLAPRRRTRLSPAASLAIWTALVAMWLVDARGPHAGQHAAVFTLIISGISWLATELAAVAEVTVAYLATAVSWLGGHLASLFTNTGTMFSKVWEGARIVYSDVLKPFAVWVKDGVLQLATWVQRGVLDLIDWAKRVAEELKSLYKRFVKPILDVLDTTRAVLDILAKLHVPFAQAAENVVSDIEQTIVHNYLRILGYVNDVVNTLNGYFTLDGLLQRFTFLRTIERDAFYVWRVMANSRQRSITGDEQESLQRATETQSVPELNDSLAAYWGGERNDVGDVIDHLSTLSVDAWQSGGADVAA